VLPPILVFILAILIVIGRFTRRNAVAILGFSVLVVAGLLVLAGW
jgi:hypothetical protein